MCVAFLEHRSPARNAKVVLLEAVGGKSHVVAKLFAPPTREVCHGQLDVHTDGRGSVPCIASMKPKGCPFVRYKQRKEAGTVSTLELSS